MLKNKRFYIIPVLGFILLILFFLGIFLFPISTNSGMSFIDALFLSTSSITGTGLSTLNVTTELTFFGKLMLLLSVQLGALGLMIFFSFLVFIRNKKINLSNTMILSNEINFNNYSKVKEKTIDIVKYTLSIEFLGAMLLAIFFIPQYGFVNGMWYGIFHSVSAFCNAGFDILGDSSLITYKNHIPINLIIMVLMFFGSVGYFVIDDMCNILKGKIKRFQTHSKIILITSIILIISSAIVVKLLNPNMTILQAIFTSITCRSTGFATYDMSTLDRPSKLLLTAFMFIGGASGSTSAGIRVTNFAIVMLLPIAVIKNEDLVIGYKRIDTQTIKKSLTIEITYINLVMLAFFVMLIIESFDTLDLLFEIVSAFTTTGLSTFNVNDLSIISKLILIFYMYIGRLGPLTFLTLFTFRKKKDNSITYPSADLMI